ncbi:MAG: lipoyl(octanoyl) transferase LipB [Rhodospirillaceae bacterium]|nr:lipoyl(octanoyl) transferase LipB [Rhodospirillaceae bacterium]
MVLRDISTSENAVDWCLEEGLMPYARAVEKMQARASAIREQANPDAVWLVEHPPLYTAGTSANDADLLDKEKFPVFKTGRGGQHTYHGPGQRVGYVMMDLKNRNSDVRKFVHDLEEWMIQTARHFDVTALRREGRVGIWVPRNDGSGLEDKIGAIGVRVRKWVSFHGIAFNVHPDLSHFSGIVPCGVAEHGVTSLRALGVDASMNEVDKVMRNVFENVFARKTADSSF